MPRFLPMVPTLCRVWGARFDLLHGYDEEAGALTTEPGACPACTAPLLFAPMPSVGRARGLVLTLPAVS